MQSTKLPSERLPRIQLFHKRLLIPPSPEQPRRITATLSIANSPTIQNEITLPRNTKHPPKAVESKAADLAEMRRLGTGTQPNTMPIIQYHALPKATKAMMQTFRRSAGTEIKGQSTSSRSLLLHMPRDAASGLKESRQLPLEVTWLDRR